MTKEEFLSIISDEIDNLNQEHRKARQKVDYLSEVNSKGKEIQEATYYLSFVEEKIRRLERLVGLPAYARIQEMSDAEIEAYRKKKIEELESKIKEIESKEQEERAKLSQLKDEQEELMSQFGSLSGDERAKVISRGKEVAAEISRYENDDQMGVFETLQKEIKKLKKQQEEIETKTSQEIKEELCSKIENREYFDKEKELYDSLSISEWERLLARVASDPEKALQMAELMVQYENLSKIESRIEVTMTPGGIGRLPKLSEEISKHGRHYYDLKNQTLYDPDQLMVAIEDYETSFKKSKAIFMEQFTEEKMSGLVGKEYGIHSSEVDIDFLQKHSDKLGDDKLDHLQDLVIQRDKLSRKIFKSRDTKGAIDALNIQIKDEQSKIYEKIIDWYKKFESKNRDILSISYLPVFPLTDAETFRRRIKYIKEDISDSEESINSTKKHVQEKKAEMNRLRENYKTKKTEIAQKMGALAAMETPPYIGYVSSKMDANLGSILGNSGAVYEKEVFNRVQQEARNQANIAEDALIGESTTETLSTGDSKGNKK